jgi:hypothetical protein
MRSSVRIEWGSEVKVGVEVVIEVEIELSVTRRTTATSEAPGALGSRDSLRSLHSPSAAVLVPEDSVFRRSPHSVRLTVAGVPRALRPLPFPPQLPLCGHNRYRNRRWECGPRYGCVSESKLVCVFRDRRRRYRYCYCYRTVRAARVATPSGRSSPTVPGCGGSRTPHRPASRATVPGIWFAASG